MKVNNTEKTGAKVGWEKKRRRRRKGGAESEREGRRGEEERLNPHTIIIRTHMQPLL